MTTTSRRAVLAGAATLPALAVPALAGPNSEAELIALGKELYGAILEWLPLDAEHNRLGALAHDLAYERAGGFQGEYPTKDEARRIYKELVEAEIEVGWRSLIESEQEATNRILALMRRIKAINPTTVAGLGVWALAMAYDLDCAGRWEKDKELDHPDDEVQAFVATCLAAAGVANPFLRTEAVQS